MLIPRLSINTRPGSATGNGRNSTLFSALKIAVLAPMPRARVRMAETEKEGVFTNKRSAKEKSCQRDSKNGKLRESRAIGQDADSIWHLDLNGERVPKDQPVVLRVEKNREGPAPVTVDLLFKKQFTRFESVARSDHDGVFEPGERE